MNKYIVFTFWLTAAYTSLAQQPAYFILGENQFKGLKVFDIIQDFEHNYYFATNEGIIKYDYIKYSKVEIKQAKSNAFFNFTISKLGTIYFNNLNNQIFAIKNEGCELFYELTNDESSTLIYLDTDNFGNLMVGCKGIKVLAPNAKLIHHLKSNTVFNTCYKLDNQTWMFPVSGQDSVILYDKSKFTFKGITSANFIPKKNHSLHFFDYQDTCYAIEIFSKTVYIFDKTNWELSETDKIDFFNSGTNARVYTFGKTIWSSNSISGVNYCEKSLKSPYQYFYDDYFISDVYEDKEGNMLLGTFDKGVLVIPNLKIPDVINPFSTEPMVSIYTHKNGDVYLGSNKGTFYVYKNNKLVKISAQNKKTIEGIYGSPLSGFLIFDDGKIKCFDTKTKEIYEISASSLKDVAFLSSNEIYLGTNDGIHRIKLGHNNTYPVPPLKNIRFRIYSLAFNLKKEILYFSSSKGFFNLNKHGIQKRILYKGKDIYPEKIVYVNDQIYALTREFGIMVIDNLNKISIIKPKLSENDETIKNLLAYKNSLLLSTSNGMYKLSKMGKVLDQYHSQYGFASKKIYNFSLIDHILWVNHAGGVQKIDLSAPKNNSTLPQVRFKELRVNNALIDINNLHHFSTSERKFEFVIYSPTLRNYETIKYHYQLKGYDEHWQTQGFELNNIIYSALSPGQYTLSIKAENLGIFGPEKKYSFTIASPIYSKPWFIVASLFIFLSSVYAIYWRQLNIQKQKSKQINELNQSKLTAIQSQMNPHFIFNSLNSIQNLVLQQNATKAYESIGKFALLIRKIMHHSEKEFIDIEEELSILNVYLELELLRMKKDFSYEIKSNGLTDIEIPPMLIQPYIENAIKHGLLHKAGHKEIEIDMRLEDKVFVCEITDNGIGRKKSQEIKERQNTKFESFSGNSLNKRLAILKKHFGGNFGVEIVDLYDDTNNATGTKVILKAPFIQKF